MKKTAEIKRAVYTWCLSSGLLEKLASDDTDVKLPTHSLPLLTHPIAGGAAATAVAKRTLDTAARDGARNFLYATGVAMPRPLGFSGKEHIYRAMVEQMPGITYGRNFNALGNGYGGLGYRTSKEIYETLRKKPGYHVGLPAEKSGGTGRSTMPALTRPARLSTIFIQLGSSTPRVRRAALPDYA